VNRVLFCVIFNIVVIDNIQKMVSCKFVNLSRWCWWWRYCNWLLGSRTWERNNHFICSCDIFLEQAQN